MGPGHPPLNGCAECDGHRDSHEKRVNLRAWDEKSRTPPVRALCAARRRGSSSTGCRRCKRWKGGFRRWRSHAIAAASSAGTARTRSTPKPPEVSSRAFRNGHGEAGSGSRTCVCGIRRRRPTVGLSPRAAAHESTPLHRDFASLAAFDTRRVGSHVYDWTPELEDGRRCLDVEEEADWLRGRNGRWTTTTLAIKARKLRAHHAQRKAA
jgi:hypothetical protein